MKAPVQWAWWVHLIMLPIYAVTIASIIVLFPFYWGYRGIKRIFK